MNIHPTALVEDGAKLAEGVLVGPWCHVGPEVTLDAGVELLSHVVVTGRTKIGARTRIWPFTSLGHAPQDLKYRGERTQLEVGSDCLIREHVTVNRGTVQGGGMTRIGCGTLLMAGVHVAHDCRLGERVVVASGAALGGHVQIGDYAIIGGLSGVHQFVRVGAHAIIGGMSGVDRDVIPFGSAVGNRAELVGLNLVGLKRRGFAREVLAALREAYDMIFFGEDPVAESAARVAARWSELPEVQMLAGFVRAPAKRPLCVPRQE